MLLPTVSIIIPAYNEEAIIERVLRAVLEQATEGVEIIVIDDGSTDGTSDVCARLEVRLMRLSENGGPAHARNLGARMATGELLLFLDADTCLRPGMLAKIMAAFDRDPALEGLIGAYDDRPAAPGVLSQYRNLLHCFIHRTAHREASTFWSGCGAIRRDVFFEYSGFDERYRRPSIEDLEFGYRLHRAGRKVLMDPEIQVKHLKRWTFPSMLETDVMHRGVPWTELILREGFMPDDLNLGMRQRLSVVGVYGAILLAVLCLVVQLPQRYLLLFAAVLLLATVLAINKDFYRFLYVRRGLRFTVQAAALHLLFYFYNGAAFGVGVVCWMHRSGPIGRLRRRLVEIFTH
jgi:glycosyltransferase involved in cell wall biosynthesis